jgi:hypothetical protein
MDANTANVLRARQRAVSLNRQEWESPARAARRPLLQRLFRRKEVTTFHRCLAVHMHFAERRGVFH